MEPSTNLLTHCVKQTLLLFLVFFIGAQTRTNAQDDSDSPPVFQGKRFEATTETVALNQTFSAYRIYQLDVNILGKYVHKAGDQKRTLILHFGDEQEWTLVLEPVNMVMPGSILTIVSEDGAQQKTLPLIRAFKGVIADDPENSEVRLTINDNFIYGFVRQGDKSIFIEPLGYHANSASPDLFVLYNAADVKPNSNNQCGSKELKGKKNELQAGNEPDQAPCSGCKIIGLEVASDFSMFQSYSSPQALLNHHIGIINNVNSVYDNEFSCEIRFVITQLFFSTCPTCDPWTASANGDDLLNSFKNWANSGGFCGINNALRELWTKRDIYFVDSNGNNYSLIGVAFKGTVCESKNCHILEHSWGATAANLRNLTAHEIGHNFNSGHDYDIGSGCEANPGRGPLMMDPIVSATLLWSNGTQPCALNSVSTISNYTNGLSCIGNCGTLLTDVWIDFNYQNCLQFGTFDFPYNLLQFGLYLLEQGSTITIKSSISKEVLTINKPCTIKAWNGPATIGAQ